MPADVFLHDLHQRPRRIPTPTLRPISKTKTRYTVAMTDKLDSIDPALLPPRSQAYTSAPQHNGGHPYYLSTPTYQQPPQQSAPTSALDPALGQTSPIGREGSPDDDDQEDDGDHDGYVAQWPEGIQRTLTSQSAHATPGSAKSPGDIKRPRACDSCRGLKVIPLARHIVCY